MKRLLCLMLMLMLLCGCGKTPEESTPETTIRTTEPTQTTATEADVGPTLLERAEVWDEAGVLRKLPVELLEENPDLQVKQVGDGLLFWQFEYGKEWIEGIHLWMVELDHGTVTADRTLPLCDYIEPRILDGLICLCDSSGGTVTVLDDQLQTLRAWEVEPDYGTWFLGAEDVLYKIEDGARLTALNLNTMETETVLDHKAGMYLSGMNEYGASLCCTDPELGRRIMAYVDLESGTVEMQPFGGTFGSAERAEDIWLCRSSYDGRNYRLGTGSAAWDLCLEGGLLHLLPDGYLLEESVDGYHLYLYDLSGAYLAGCSRTGDSGFLNGSAPMRSEKLGGYLFLVHDMDGSHAELIFWDLTGSEEHEDLTMTQVDLTLTPEDELDLLRQRAEEIGEQYGLKIWLGSECETDFDDFTAVTLTDPELVEQQLDILERALAGYPEGFFYQLRYGGYEQIHIQLVADLMAKPHYGTGGSYGGFTQPRDGYYLMVINTNYAAEGTYYHEFSHIIDNYLEWDSWQREDALFSWDGWMALNPEDFEYSYDYAVLNEFTGNWDAYFIDQYAMINPTEDRARIMEYGMLEYMQWRFDEMPGAVEKLRYYSACIRDAFDTSGWPEELLWEQYVP